MSIFAPTNNSMLRRSTGFAIAQENARRAQEEQAARAADPVEQALKYIRSRGRVIFKASVHGGPDNRWKHAGKLLDAAGVLALEASIRSLQPALAPAPVPPAAPPTSPIIFVGKPADKPPARKAPTQKENAMGHHLKAETAEQANCRARGVSPAKVKADLIALRNLLGAGGAADRLGVGKSTVGNIIGGHSSVGPTILAALYGDGGCTLKPDLAALLTPPAVPESVTAGQPDEKHIEPDVERPAEAAHAVAPSVDLPAFQPVDAVETLTLDTLEMSGVDKITLRQLLAAAEGRRTQLQAELAALDDQIKAVLHLSLVAV